MPDQKLTDRTELTAFATGDKVHVVDVSDTTDNAQGTSKWYLISTLSGYLASLAQTLTNKTLTSPVINTPTGDVVTITGSETLTNKTLTSPTITSPIIDFNNSITITQIATPANPSAGKNKIYTKTGGKPFVLGSAGQEAVIQTVYTNTVTSHATPTINTDTTDIFTITALAVAITSMTTNLSGTPVNGQKLIIRIKDDGTARSITWGASFSPAGATTTTLGKTQYNGCIYNSTSSKWDIVATVNEA